jgi:hypothetical protein
MVETVGTDRISREDSDDRKMSIMVNYYTAIAWSESLRFLGALAPLLFGLRPCSQNEEKAFVRGSTTRHSGST